MGFSLRTMCAQNAFHEVVLRKDMAVAEVHFDDIVGRPLDVFGALAHEGWPIDPKKAAKIPDPEKVHF